MYNQNFIEKVERVYGANSTIAQCAREGSYLLGRYLDDSQDTISYNDILNKDHIECQLIALRAKERHELYAEWFSGNAFTKDSLRTNYCPINYLQNVNAPNRYDMQFALCKGVGYVGYYPHCKKWGCKSECWKKYDEIIKGDQA